MKLGLLAFSAAMLVAGRVQAAPAVWVVDDGEKIRRDATDTPFEHGVGNPVWQPGQPVRLFAMRNESVAMQVVVEADAAAPLDASRRATARPMPRPAPVTIAARPERSRCMSAV